MENYKARFKEPSSINQVVNDIEKKLVKVEQTLEYLGLISYLIGILIPILIIFNDPGFTTAIFLLFFTILYFSMLITAPSMLTNFIENRIKILLLKNIFKKHDISSLGEYQLLKISLENKADLYIEANTSIQKEEIIYEEKQNDILPSPEIAPDDHELDNNLVQKSLETEKEEENNLISDLVEGFIESEIESTSSEENNKIGLLGEEFVLEFEKNKFMLNEEYALVSKVKHASKIYGDGLGYDILSYDSQGNELYIEVKTTIGKVDNQFFMSKNELEFFSENANCVIYRVYNFNPINKTGKIKVITEISAITTHSVSYKITPKKIKL